MPADDRGASQSALARAEAELEGARQTFALSVTALEHEVVRSLAWREWVRRKPATTLALAFGLGFLIGRRI